MLPATAAEVGSQLGLSSQDALRLLNRMTRNKGPGYKVRRTDRRDSHWRGQRGVVPFIWEVA